MKYSRQKLEEMARGDAFFSVGKTVHKERCDADLLYALFFAPDSAVPGEDAPLVDCLLRSFSAIVAKKNAPAYNKNNRIAVASNFLRRADTTLKTFNVLFMLNREPELQDLVRAAYGKNNLWGEESGTHLDNFLRHLHVMVERTLDWPYNERNVVEVVRNFVHSAQSHYLFAK